MRFLVYLLLLANVAVFVWFQTHPPQPPAEQPPPPLPPGIERLVLLSERPAAAQASGQPAVEEPQQQAVGQPGAVQMTESSGQDSPGTAGTATAEAAPEGGTQETSEPAAPPVSAEAAATEVKTVSPPEPVPGTAPAVEVGTAPAPVCRTIGPFADPDAAARLARQLSQQGFGATVRDAGIREPSGYWVYLPAMPRAEARRIVDDLKAHGVKDYFVGKQHYISLGIFSRKHKAGLRQEQIRKLGYDAVLERRYRTRKVYWIDVEEQGQELQASSVWQTLQSQNPEAQLQQIDCE